MIEALRAVAKFIAFSFLTAVWLVSIAASYEAHLKQKQMIAYIAAAQACKKVQKEPTDLET